MPGKPPSQASVQVVEREIDLPSSRAARRDKIRSDTLSPSVAAGATATGTIVTNNSSANWLIFTLSSTVEESVSPGDISLEIKIRDEDGNVVYGGAGGVVSTQPIGFGEGGIVRPGWSVDYRIVNASGASATVHLYPYISRSAVDDLGQSTPTPDDYIDNFERSTVLGPYTYTSVSGTTNNNFQGATNDVYEGTQVLEFAGTSDTEALLSMPGDGLDNYPSLGDDWTARVEPKSISDTFYSGILFGMDSTIDNGYLLRFGHGKASTALLKFTSGSSEVLASANEDLGTAQYYKARVAGDDPIDVSIFDENGDSVLAFSASNPSPRHDNGGFGYWVEGSDTTSNNVRFDDIKL